MLRTILLAGFAVAAVSPSLANAQECGPGNRVAGTVVGAGVGALLGSALSGGHAGGAIMGGVGGAVAGNAIAGASNSCSNQFGHYDANGAWVPNTATSYGYYGPDGRWVDTGPPPGPAAYAPPPQDAPAARYDTDAYNDPNRWGDAPRDIRQRADWLEHRIRAGLDQGVLDPNQGHRLLASLDDIRRMDADYRRPDGYIDPAQRDELEARLDDIRGRLHDDLREDRSGVY